MTLINSSKMAALLICAGAIPFILLTALVAYNIEFNYFEPKAALKSYALAIGSSSGHEGGTEGRCSAHRHEQHRLGK